MKNVAINGRTSDLSGLRYDKLVALEPLGKIDGYFSWYCQCDCGMYCFVSGSELRFGKRGSCGLYACKLVDLVEKVPVPSNTLRRDPLTSSFISGADYVEPRTKKKVVMEDDSTWNINTQLMSKRAELIDKIKPGDTVKYACTARYGKTIGFAYTNGIVIAIKDDSFVINTPRGIRRIVKSLVRFDYNGEQHAK